EPDKSRWPMMLCYSGAIILFIAAVLCQPTLLALSPLFLLLTTFHRRTSARDFLICAPFFAISLAFLCFALLVDPRTVHILSPILTTLLDAFRFGLRVLWPWPIVAVFIEHPLDSHAIISYLIPAAILLAIAFALMRRHFNIAKILLIFICLIPTVWDARISGSLGSLVPGRDACQYLFGLPIIVGLIALAVSRISKIGQPTSQAISRLALGAALITALATAGWFASDANSSSESLWLAAVAADPASDVARAQLATWYLENGNIEQAEKQTHHINLNASTDVRALLVCGEVSEARGSLDQAIDSYHRAVQIQSADPRPASYLASAYFKANRPDDATATFKRALLQYPNDPGVRSDFGLLLNQQGNPAAAIEQFNDAIRLDNNFVPARLNLSSALFETGKLQEAADQLQAVVKIDPQNFEAFHNAGVMLCQLHDFDSAARMLTMAVQLRPDSPEARNDLGVALSAGGKYKRATYEFQQAVALRPNYDAARRNLEITERHAAAATLPTS
ncbi:MAG TPA: tetratricopeptide repeat protein, partial [Tepidisphaeraceae bacterium]|nr:tetratricopeptide repeat protein [Tepidisphaeraceae bacterium]